MWAALTHSPSKPQAPSNDDDAGKLVLLWDMLKVVIVITNIRKQQKLRKSEEDEMARLIGPEIL